MWSRVRRDSTPIAPLRRHALLAGAGAAALGVLSACGSSAGGGGTGGGGTASKEPLVIAGVFDESGTFGHFGQIGLQAMQTQVDIINSNGGVDGRRLSVQSLDDGSDPAKAVVAARQLLSSVPMKDLLFFSPGSVGVTTLAILPVTTQAKVLTLSPSATAAIDNVEKFPYAFETYPAAAQQSVAQVLALKQLTGGNKKVAMVVGTDSGDQANIAPFSALIKQEGLEVADVENVSLSTSDFTPTLDKIRHLGVTAMYVKIDSPPANVNLMKGVQQLGWTEAQVLAGPTAANATVLTGIPAAVATQFHALGERAYIQGYGSDSKQFQSFVSRLSAQGPVTDVGISANYADEVNMAVWAYKKAGGNDQAKMRAALENLGGSDLPAGTLMALPQPHYTSSVHDLAGADFSSFWGLLRPAAAAVNSQWPGDPLDLPKKIS